MIRRPRGNAGIRRVLCGLALLSAASLHAQVAVDFPLGIGFRLPAYDRVDGASIPFGPTVSFGDDRLLVDPVLTYRSHLGKVDPALTATVSVDSMLTLSVTGSRGTFSNDRWIRPDLINSLYALGLGIDSRNDFRADRAEGRATLTIPRPFGDLGFYAGARLENAWSTGWRAGEDRGPFSVFGRRDVANGIERPNPVIDPGHIASMVAGAQGSIETDRATTDFHVRFEGAWHTSVVPTPSAPTPPTKTFQQLTLDQQGTIPTVAGQQLEVAIHAVTTWGGAAPPQRYAYVGGSGTLATLDVLALGGDHMYFLDALYVIPIPGPGINLPLLGSIFVAPHFATGAAAVGGFGVPTQNIGVRLGTGFVRIDYLVNPRTRQQDLGAGLAFSR